MLTIFPTMQTIRWCNNPKPTPTQNQCTYHIKADGVYVSVCKINRAGRILRFCNLRKYIIKGIFSKLTTWVEIDNHRWWTYSYRLGWTGRRAHIGLISITHRMVSRLSYNIVSRLLLSPEPGFRANSILGIYTDCHQLCDARANCHCLTAVLAGPCYAAVPIVTLLLLLERPYRLLFHYYRCEHSDCSSTVHVSMTKRPQPVNLHKCTSTELINKPGSNGVKPHFVWLKHNTSCDNN